MNYSKNELACIQLENAIKHYSNNDYVCSVTLAGASEEITRHILERTGKEPCVDSLKQWLRENKPESESLNYFFKNANATRNELKHFSDPEVTSVYVGEKEAHFWIMRGLMNYSRANGHLTPVMQQYVQNWLVRNASGNPGAER
jgi:hypothetical protein